VRADHVCQQQALLPGPRPDLQPRRAFRTSRLEAQRLSVIVVVEVRVVAR